MACLGVGWFDVDRQAVCAEGGRGCRPDRAHDDILRECGAHVVFNPRVGRDLEDVHDLLRRREEDGSDLVFGDRLQGIAKRAGVLR